MCQLYYIFTKYIAYGDVNWSLLTHTQYKVLCMSFCALPALLEKEDFSLAPEPNGMNQTSLTLLRASTLQSRLAMSTALCFPLTPRDVPRAINQNFCSCIDVFSVQSTRVSVKAVLQLTDIRKVRGMKLKVSFFRHRGV